MIIKDKSPVRVAIENEMIACPINYVLTYEHLAFVAGTTVSGVKRFASAAVKFVENAHHVAMLCVCGVGYRRVRAHDALGRSNAHSRSAGRKDRRALNVLPAAEDGATPATLARVGVQKMKLKFTQQLRRSHPAKKLQGDEPQKISESLKDRILANLAR